MSLRSFGRLKRALCRSSQLQHSLETFVLLAMLLLVSVSARTATENLRETRKCVQGLGKVLAWQTYVIALIILEYFNKAVRVSRHKMTQVTSNKHARRPAKQIRKT